MNIRAEGVTGGYASFNGFGDEFATNPFPLFTQMRTMGPIVQLPLSFTGGQPVWIVTRLEETVQILKDKRFTVAGINVFADSSHQQRATQTASEGNIFAQSMLMVDGLDHKRLRGLVSKAFTPKYIQSLRPQIQQIADDLLDRVEAQGSMDLVHDYAAPLPINVISDMLGVPHKNREHMREGSEVFASSDVGSTSEEKLQQVQVFSAYIMQLIAEKRQHPQDDLMSQLIHTEEAGDHLNEQELLSMVALLIFAGHETTSNLISIGSLMLFDHPEQFARLKADLSLVPSAVEEFLRFCAPVLSTVPRFATEDVEIKGQTIRKGDVLMCTVASANRDELQFTDAEELDIARSLNRHIAFGQGIHACLGAPLARLEGEIAFTTLLKRMPDLRLTIPRDTVAWRGNLNLRGLKSLPVSF